MVSEYAKQTINQKLQKILPCDFLLRVKGTSLDIYIPEEFKGRIIGKAGASINELEKNVGLRINVKVFADLPLLDVQTQVDVMQKNAVMITFPEGWGDKEAVLIVGEDLFRGRIDTHGVLAIKEKSMVKLIQKK
jgi:predicted PilT family ATPase